MQQRNQEVFQVVAGCTNLPDAVSKILVDYSVEAEQADYDATYNFYQNAIDRYNWRPVPRGIMVRETIELKRQIDMIAAYFADLGPRKYLGNWQVMLRGHIRSLQQGISNQINQYGGRTKRDGMIWRVVRRFVDLRVLSNFNRDPNPLVEGTFEEVD
jgi:hypothetical protein